MSFSQSFPNKSSHSFFNSRFTDACGLTSAVTSLSCLVTSIMSKTGFISIELSNNVKNLSVILRKRCYIYIESDKLTRYSHALRKR